VLFSKDEISRADLARYYARVAPVMVPLVKGRPVTMQRCPNGIAKRGFLQKDVSDQDLTGWVKTAGSERKGGLMNVERRRVYGRPNPPSRRDRARA
jgi:bifunctional non-homologous end joining protein LigD